MLSKIWLLFIISFIFTTNANLEAQILADCIGYYENNNINIEITIINNSENEIYVPFSDWVVNRSQKNSNYLIKYPLPNSMILISMCFIPSKFDEIGEEHRVVDYDIYDFQLKYLPKIVSVEAKDSLKFKIKFNIKNQNSAIPKENNKVIISIPYMNDDFGFIFRDNPNVYNYLYYEKEIQLDITKNLMNNILRKDWENYTKFKITDCEKKMMIMNIKDKIINCKCIIK